MPLQCNHDKVRQVKVNAMRELAGVVAGGQASGVRGVLVTSVTFTGEALREAGKVGIELIDSALPRIRRTRVSAAVDDLPPE